MALDKYGTSIMSRLNEHRLQLTESLDQLASQIPSMAKAALLLEQVLQDDGKVLVAGNGGSAAQAQHFAAELVGRFRCERAPYPVMALTTDTAILTAISNDYGYQNIFARQIQAFGQRDDLLVIFSTSGESENLICAAQAAKYRKMIVVAILGKCRCSLESLADLAIQVPAVDTAVTQELHMIVAHLLCDIVESNLTAHNQGERE